jgi:hypothetical protein
MAGGLGPLLVALEFRRFWIERGNEMDVDVRRRIVEMTCRTPDEGYLLDELAGNEVEEASEDLVPDRRLEPIEGSILVPDIQGKRLPVYVENALCELGFEMDAKPGCKMHVNISSLENTL